VAERSADTAPRINNILGLITDRLTRLTEGYTLRDAHMAKFAVRELHISRVHPHHIGHPKISYLIGKEQPKNEFLRFSF
jgi:hypothetical protein